MDGIMIWAEHREGALLPVVPEILGKALELAGGDTARVSALLIGNRCRLLADELIFLGAGMVHLVEDERLALYQSGAYAEICARIVAAAAPEIVIVGGTALGMDLAPRVAAKLRTGLTAHCVDLAIEGDDTGNGTRLAALVPGWGENALLKIACPERRPQMVTVRPGVFEPARPDPARTGEVVAVAADPGAEAFRARTVAFIPEGAAATPLAGAEIVVAGGYGFHGAGGFALLERLARALGGETAGTRAACDQGWLPAERMLGQSGSTISPRLLISIGASGAMHYTTGFRKAHIVVAVDRNSRAPIFRCADFGVVADLRTFVPALIDALEESGPY